MGSRIDAYDEFVRSSVSFASEISRRLVNRPTFVTERFCDSVFYASDSMPFSWDTFLSRLHFPLKQSLSFGSFPSDNCDFTVYRTNGSHKLLKNDYYVEFPPCAPFHSLGFTVRDYSLSVSCTYPAFGDSFRELLCCCSPVTLDLHSVHAAVYSPDEFGILSSEDVTIESSDLDYSNIVLQNFRTWGAECLGLDYRTI